MIADFWYWVAGWTLALSEWALAQCEKAQEGK